MADNHEQFIEFNNTITLDNSKKEELRENREALRKKIIKYFEDNLSDKTKPEFREQGSYKMFTIVNPIPKEEEDEEGNLKKMYPYDLDDGVVFVDKEENREKISTYHNWIYNAVKDHTTKGAERKNTCIRVLYADGHHIDLPIYFEVKDSNSNPELAHKSEGWVESNPKEFYEWFNDEAQKDYQLRRIVRYLKAWRDKQNDSYSTKMPSGLVLTILATNHFSSDERDDVAFRDTLQAIKDELDKEHKCERPTAKKGEDLLTKYSETHFKDRLQKLIDSGTKAIDDDNPKEACKKWQKHLGDRFSCSNVEDTSKSKAKSYSAPAVVNVNAGSA